MQPGELEHLEGAIFRANTAFELVLFDRLSLEQQQRLSALQKDNDFYGVLLPLQHPELGIRSVDRDTALLFFTLRTPGPMPAYVKSQLGEDYHKTILTLVLDNVFEIEWHGTWLSGVEVYELFYAKQPRAPVKGTIAQLSLEAIKYAQALEIHESTKLAMRLYSYNRLPLSAYWLRKFPTSDSVAAYLGLQDHGSNALLLKRQWLETTSDTAFSGWFAWSARHLQSESRAARFVYKLYICPACEHIRDAFQITIEALADSQAMHCKIGKDIYGLLRPDKFVVYFSSLEACQDTATMLRQKLAGMPAHGVPFSAEIAGDGLLSWGIDPPIEEQSFDVQGGESWRLWVANRLAMALLNAKSGRSVKVEPWQFALERLRLDGVDTETWIPPQFSPQTSI